jgi:hypothetical protein
VKKASNKRTVRIRRRHIIADPAADGSGYSWTLAAVLGEMLQFAEEKFGPRDQSYTLLGIDFASDGGKTWTPGNCRHIIIHLDYDDLRDRKGAYLSLAHECIHLLSPTGKRDANVLEEGLAVYFQQWYMNWCFGEGWWSESPSNAPNYAEALAYASELLALSPDIIKELRKRQPVISRITAEMIRQHCPAAPEALAIALEKPFYAGCQADS